MVLVPEYPIGLDEVVAHGRSGSSLIGDERQRLHAGPGQWDPVPVLMSAEAVVGPKVLAALLAWVM